MMCMFYSKVFDKETTKDLEKVRPRKSGRIDKKDNFTFNKRGIPHRTPRNRTYVPFTTILIEEWVSLAEKTGVDQRK